MKTRVRTHQIFKVILAAFGFLLCLRLAIPSIILHFANKELARMNGYYGHVDDIDVALLRGAYNAESLYINKIDTIAGDSTPVFSVKTIEASIEWRALLHGSIVGEIVLDRPTLSFTKDKVEPQDLRRDSARFKDLLDKVMPLRINRIEINSGRIRYTDFNTTPKVDIQLSDVNLLARNLTNSYDSANLLPASIAGTASLYEGKLNLEMGLNPLAQYPTFDLNLELNNTNLAQLNDFFNAYAKVDVNRGDFGLYVELAAKDGTFDGYVKPIIHDLDVLGMEDRQDNFLRQLWEGMVGLAGELFSNQAKEQVATKVPLEGRLDNPRTGTWIAILNILRNAFIQALQPSIDHEINIRSLEQENTS